jgi:hypothetical protein
LLFSNSTLAVEKYFSYFISVFQRDVSFGLDLSNESDLFISGTRSLKNGDTLTAITFFKKINESNGLEAMEYAKSILDYFKLINNKCNFYSSNEGSIIINNKDSLDKFSLCIYYAKIHNDTVMYNYYKRLLNFENIKKTNLAKCFMVEYFDLISGNFIKPYSKYPNGFQELIESYKYDLSGNIINAQKSIDNAIIKSPSNLFFLKYKMLLNIKTYNNYECNISLFEKMSRIIKNDSSELIELNINMAKCKSYDTRSNFSYSELLLQQYEKDKNLDVMRELLKLNSGNLNSKEQLLELIINDYPKPNNYADLYNLRIKIIEKMTEGRDSLLSLYKRENNNYIANLVIEMYLYYFEYDSAKKILDEVIQRYPNDIKFLQKKSDLLLREGKEIEYILTLTKIMEIDCCNQNAFLKLYLYYLEKQNTQKFYNLIKNPDYCYLKNNLLLKSIASDLFMSNEKDRLFRLISLNEYYFFSNVSTYQEAFINLLFLIYNNKPKEAINYINYIENKYPSIFITAIDNYNNLKSLLFICLKKYDLLEKMLQKQECNFSEYYLNSLENNMQNVNNRIILKEVASKNISDDKIFINLGDKGNVSYQMSFSKSTQSKVLELITKYKSLK